MLGEKIPPNSLQIGNDMTKYGAKRTTVDGITFASKREAYWYGIYKSMETRGEIYKLILQPKFPLIYDGKPIRSLPSKNGRIGPKLCYIADFSYVDVHTTNRHVIDVKGMDTPVSRLKRALIKAMYDVDVEIVK